MAAHDSTIPSTAPFDEFEGIKRIAPDGVEFWSARDWMPIMEYIDWRKFKNVILKSSLSYENSGCDSDEYFVLAVKMVMIGSDADERWLTRQVQIAG
ncbi:MAG TPA: hypothetical protein PLD47_09565 [Aggregatilineales bacterium]|nr:hypothetical protein [Anaerolineales bacterium]HRE47960.1 hypothetical protein [Aggregatilineales bacterium]